jgi:hypothetical protein
MEPRWAVLIGYAEYMGQYKENMEQGKLLGRKSRRTFGKTRQSQVQSRDRPV